MNVLSSNETWAARRTDLDLPTYRQIQYWASSGALGERLRPRGSGFHLSYTPADYLRLAAIKRLSDDIGALNLDGSGRGGLLLGLVAEVWRQLEATGRAVLTHGSVTIDLSLEAHP